MAIYSVDLQREKKMKEAETVKNKIWRELNQGASLTRLCNIVEQFTGNPVAATLTTLTIIARSKGYHQNLVNEYISFGKSIPVQRAEDFFLQADKTFLLGEPVIRPLPFVSCEHAMCGAIMNETLIGVVDMPLVNREPSEEDLKLFQYASEAISIALVINGYVVKDTYHPMQNYILSLLNGSIDSVSYHNPYHIRAMLNGIEALKMAWLCPKQKDNTEMMESELISFCRKHDHFWLAPYNNSFVIVFDVSQETALQKLLKITKGKAQVILTDSFFPIEELHRQMKLCILARNIAAYENNSDAVLYAGVYKTTYAALVPLRNGEEDLYDNPVFRDLALYDEKSGSAYLETLRAYFRCRQDIPAMADNLCVHKNTVFYRLSRMKEQFGIDFTDIRQMMGLYIAMLVHDEAFEQNRDRSEQQGG